MPAGGYHDEYFELRAVIKKLEAKVETANIALRQIKNLNPELPDDKRAFDNGYSVFRIAEATLDKLNKEDNLQEEKIKINFTQDGNKICATLADSIDLQSSPAGFGVLIKYNAS